MHLEPDQSGTTFNKSLANQNGKHSKAGQSKSGTVLKWKLTIQDGKHNGDWPIKIRSSNQLDAYQPIRVYN
jgi:hypothetical protein